MYKLMVAVVVTAVALTGILALSGCPRQPDDPMPEMMEVVPPPEEILPSEEPVVEEPEEPVAEEEALEELDVEEPLMEDPYDEPIEPVEIP